MDLNSNQNSESFLDKVAKTLLEKYPENLQNITVVFPNRRAKLFLEKSFQNKISKPIWLPQIFGFDDYVQKLTGKTYSSDLEIKMHLFDCYQKVYGKQESLEDFLKWSSIIISDFNDILESGADSNQLLEHLEKIRSIENWEPEEGQTSQLQSSYLNFWHKLPTLFQTYVKGYIEEKLFSRSFAEKELSENFDTYFKEEVNHTYFIGFNALTGTELDIFKKLKALKRATFIWDIDDYYFQNSFHEAGKPIKQAANLLDIEKPSFLTNSLTVSQKKIKIIGAQGNYNQAKLLGNFLSAIHENDLKQTAVVLGNTEVLPQVLNALPENIKAVNISAGLKIQHQPIFKLFNLLLKLWKNHAKKTSFSISFKEFIAIISNPIFNSTNYLEQLKNIESYLISNNIIQIGKNELNDINAKLPKDSMLLVLINFINNLCLLNVEQIDFITFIERLQQNITGSGKSIISNGSVELIKSGWIELESQVEKFSIPKNPSNIFALFKYLVAPLEQSFVGEPLEGIQIVGLLETRNIDFKNIFFLSTNEGSFPQAKVQETLIPYDIRKVFGLPTNELKDSIFSYHFYRSIQRAEKINLIFNTSSDEFGNGEKSRFIQQIETEEELSKFIVENRLFNPEIPILKKNPLKVKVNKEKLLNYLTNKGLSPSALNTYLQNPLEFYYRYVEEVREPKELEENIDAAALGDIIHTVLENIYKPFINQLINSETIDSLSKKVNGLVEIEFEKKYPNQKNLPGKTQILKEVCIEVVKNSLKSDQKNTDFTINGLEQGLEAFLIVDKFEIKLKGLIDRLDTLKGNLRIIDYKTGKVEPKELGIENINLIFSSPIKSKAIQLLFYALLVSECKKEIINGAIEAGIMAVRSSSKGVMNLKINKSKILQPSDIQNFKTKLTDIIRNMISSEYLEENLNYEYKPFYAF